MNTDFNVGDLVMRLDIIDYRLVEAFGIGVGIVIRKEPLNQKGLDSDWAEYTVFWPSSGMTEENRWSVHIAHCKDIIDLDCEEIQLSLKGREDMQLLNMY